MDITWILLEAGANPLNAVDKVLNAMAHTSRTIIADLKRRSLCAIAQFASIALL